MGRDVSTDWQSLVAICIALACTAWMVRYVARPFVTRVARICQKCGSCPAAEEGADLLQIQPPAARETQN